MLTATTRPHAPPAATTLYVAFELGNSDWKLAMTTRVDQTPLVRAMAARALKTLEAEIARAKAHSNCRPRLRSGAATRRGATDSGFIVIS